LEDLGIDGMDHRETGWEIVDRIHVTHDGNQCWAFVNMVVNIWVP
jgi:hypothetical protein